MAMQAVATQVLQVLSGLAHVISVKDPAGLSRHVLAAAVLASALLASLTLERLVLRPLQVSLVLAGAMVGWYVFVGR